jgi:processive 1,2-diacylglycerol beta-glucosyltransferase
MKGDDGPILILYASTGAGHMIAARALEAAFRAQAPDAEIEVHDLLDTTTRLFRTLYAGGYLAIVRHLPLAMGVLYDAMDLPNRPMRHALRRGFQKLNTRRARHFLISRRPRLVVNTHYFPAEIVAGLRRARRLECPQVMVTTDFETHRIWVHAPTERYYTADEQGKAYLTTWGVDPGQVLVTGIPVRPGFEPPVDRRKIRQRCQLDRARPVVLLLAGGFGVGSTEEALRELMSIDADVQIVVISGRNEGLQRRLDGLASDFTCPVRVLGYTDLMHEWMAAADLVVSKAGGLTVAEALACGVPMVVVDPIPGQEQRNSDYVLERGAAIRVNNMRMLGYRVSELLANPVRLRRLRKAARGLGQPGAAARIAADTLSLLETRHD